MAVVDRKGEEIAALEPDLAAAPATSPGASRRASALRVGALGASTWLASVAVPMGEGGVHSLADVVLALLPIFALAIGVRAYLAGRDEATPLLAIAFPTLVATAIGGRADPALAERYGGPMVVLSGLAMLSYAIAAAHALGRPGKLRETRVSKLVSTPDGSARVRSLRRLVLGTSAAAAVGLTLVAPALGSRARFAEAWGDAAEEGRVVVAVLAVTMATLALTAIVGPSLRAARPGEPRGNDGATVVASIVVAVTFAMAWAILRYLDR